MIQAGMISQEAPCAEGTENPERLDILAVDLQHKSLLAFEIKGLHSSLTNRWRIISEGANMLLMVFLLRSFPLIQLEGFENLHFTTGWDLARVGSRINTGLKVVLILSLIGTGIEILRRLYREISTPAR